MAIRNIEIELTPELKKLGAPTFEEFKRNREKYLGKDDDHFGRIDKGSVMLKRQEQRHIYEIEGHRCKSLEEVERVANDFGVKIKELDYRPEIIPQSGHKCDILVKFIPKYVRDRRQSWE
jgi:hypothetical protein